MKHRKHALAILIVSVLLLGGSLAAARASSPLAANNVGTGGYTGSLACPDDTITLTVAGAAINTVITGYPGVIKLTGSCDASTLVLTATGDAITGSTLRCASLTGTPSANGVPWAVVTGSCQINSYDTRAQWDLTGNTPIGGTLTFTRPGG